jgi:hypothetical protein
VICLTAWLLAGSLGFADDLKPIVEEDAALGRPVDFEKDVRPILQANCTACHNVTTNEGGVILETVESMLKGGGSSPVLVPGKPEESLLYKLSRRGDEPVMPPMPNDRQAQAAHVPGTLDRSSVDQRGSQSQHDECQSDELAADQFTNCRASIRSTSIPPVASSPPAVQIASRSTTWPVRKLLNRLLTPVSSHRPHRGPPAPLTVTSCMPSPSTLSADRCHLRLSKRENLAAGCGTGFGCVAAAGQRSGFRNLSGRSRSLPWNSG